MAGRIAVGLLALGVLAWFGVLERGVRLEARGDALAQELERPGQADRAAAAFRAARWLDPDTTPDVKRAFVLQEARRPEAATALLRDVVRREPDNLAAWGVLYTFTKDADPATAARARAAARRLNPPRAPAPAR